MNENLDKSDSVHRVKTEVKSFLLVYRKSSNHDFCDYTLYVYYDLIYRKITDFEQI